MEKEYGLIVDKKFLLVLILVCVVLSGSFAFLYMNLKEDFVALRNDYKNLSAQIRQLQSTIEGMHYNQTLNLTAVQIYNQTKYSVVLVANRQYDSYGNLVTVSEGSGFVYDENGYIVTNNHVVEGADDITVTFLDGTVAEAQPMSNRIYCADIYSDLAVIKVDTLPKQANPLILGNSSALKVGEPVYTIGNPFGKTSSMTAGIVSQVGRVLRLADLGVPAPWGYYSIADVVQFDAAVNPGNSGGPLLNSLGEVVGVTFAIETSGNVRAFVGIGYAIPSNLVKRVIPSLIKTGHYYHPWIGIEMVNMNKDIAEAMHTNWTHGALIVSVNESSPAASAGLKGGKEDWTITIEGQTIPLGGDIIIKVNNYPVVKTDDLIIYLERYTSPGDTITLTLIRDNVEMVKPLTLGKR